jgi:hypothetical protein
MKKSVACVRTYAVALIGLLLLIGISHGAVSQHVTPNIYFHWDPPRLYFQCDWTYNDFNWSAGQPTGYEPALLFAPDNWNDMIAGDDKYGYFWGWIELEPNDNITLSIHEVRGRIFNPDIDTLLCLDVSNRTRDQNLTSFLDMELRFDGDGNGDFEYILVFPRVEVENADRDLLRELEPSDTIGDPVSMTNGTIELEIIRSGNATQTLHIVGTPYSDPNYSYIDIPFDLDTDNDGIGDFSDPDDDNDGHDDIDDWFPKDSNEWLDSDWDGIGNNADIDANGNFIPDVFEFVLIIFAILIPVLIVFAIVIRKKGFYVVETMKKK